MRITRTLMTGAVIAGLALPMAAQAAEQDVQQRIDALSKEIETLKQQTKRVEDKSLGKWLTIGGDYRFRVDSLRGETKPYVDVNRTFANAGNLLQADFFGNPSTAAGSSTYFGGAPFSMSTAGALSALMNFQTAMSNVRTYSDATAFLTDPMNGGLVQGLGGFAVAVPSYKPKNDTLYTNRFGLDLHAKATQDVMVNVRLLMYKTFGSNNDDAVTGTTPYFADRVGVFDGTLGHIPSSDYLNVDRAYATWSNIAEQPVWFSVGRRPSTNGIPENLRLNTERPGNGGTPALLVDYAFDGMTLGWAPDIEALPGAYTKVCYGRGFEAGIENPTGNTLRDTDMLGVALIPIDTDPIRLHLQWNRGFNIFDFPQMENTAFGNTAPAANLGDIDWFGTGILSTLKKVGPGTLNTFAEFGLSVTHPNDNVSANAGFQGLGTGSFFQPEAPNDKTGWAAYAGARYDLPSGTKLGFEYNHGSKNWITFAPAADDMWTAKVGTRGNVYEGYIIQELNLKPVSSYFSKTFFKIGYQHYDFDYTGSNNWVGAPQKISSLTGNEMQLLAPLKTAQNIYATFEVKF